MKETQSATCWQSPRSSLGKVLLFALVFALFVMTSLMNVYIQSSQGLPMSAPVKVRRYSWQREKPTLSTDFNSLPQTDVSTMSHYDEADDQADDGRYPYGEQRPNITRPNLRRLMEDPLVVASRNTVLRKSLEKVYSQRHDIQAPFRPTHKQSPPALIKLLPKSWWSAGYVRDAPAMFPEVVDVWSQDVIVRWSPSAIRSLEAHFMNLQRLTLISDSFEDDDSCFFAPEDLHTRFVDVPVSSNARLMRAIRDYSTLFLESTLANMSVLLRQDENATHAFCTNNDTLGGDQFFGCFFEPTMGCASPLVGPHSLSTEHQSAAEATSFDGDNLGFIVPADDDLDMSPLILARLLALRAIWWETASGDRVSAEHGLSNRLRTAMLTSSLHSVFSSVLFKPLAATQHAIDTLTTELAIAMHAEGLRPMLVVHMSVLSEGVDRAVLLGYGDQTLPLHVFAEALVELEDEIKRDFRSILVVCDDPLRWEQRASVLSTLRNASAGVRILSSPYWDHITPGQDDGLWDGSRRADAAGANVPSPYDLHMHLLAEIEVASRYGDYVFGPGSSPVSQYIAQRIGARYRMDGNWFSYWQEDFFVRQLLREENEEARDGYVNKRVLPEDPAVRDAIRDLLAVSRM